MRKINSIFVHCAATPPDMNIGAKEIRAMHVNGRGWSDIGYHYVIRRDGTIEEGRPIERNGAHARGHNKGSIGVCMVGGVSSSNKPDANFTFRQYESLNILLKDLKNEYMLSNHDIHGHRDVAAKACPSFDIHSFLE